MRGGRCVGTRLAEIFWERQLGTSVRLEGEAHDVQQLRTREQRVAAAVDLQQQQQQ